MKFIFLSLSLLFVTPTWANNVQISNLSYDEQNNRLTFNISWDNGFYINNHFRDYVYVFIKYKNSNSQIWQRMTFPLSGHSEIGGIQADYHPQSKIINGERFAIKINHLPGFQSGSSSGTAIIQLSNQITLVKPSFKVFGIEMIEQTNVGSTNYSIGDGSSTNRVHQGNNVNLPFIWDGGIEEINVGTGLNDINVTGASFPVTSIPYHYFSAALNLMRYEISQEQYVDFLNCLTREQQNTRTGTDISGTSITQVFVMSSTNTPINRNAIRCKTSLSVSDPVFFYCDLNNNGVPNETFDGQNIAANYLLPKDLLAYLDWAGLRPLNEFQYEFAARGTDPPIAGEFAWGTSTKNSALINGSQGGPGEVPANLGDEGLFRAGTPLRCGFAATSSSSRSQSGASFFGAMELSGNVAELVIGSYSPSDFPTSTLPSGDGTLDINGDHNVSTWPNNLTTKGSANTSSTLRSVSHRSGIYASPIIRSQYFGGRGRL